MPVRESSPCVPCLLSPSLGPTTVPLGRQTIISTGKLYFSKCRPASCLWSGFSCWVCGDSETSWYLGPVLSRQLPQAAPPIPRSPAGPPAPLPGTRY